MFLIGSLRATSRAFVQSLFRMSHRARPLPIRSVRMNVICRKVESLASFVRREQRDTVNPFKKARKRPTFLEGFLFLSRSILLFSLQFILFPVVWAGAAFSLRFFIIDLCLGITVSRQLHSCNKWKLTIWTLYSLCHLISVYLTPIQQNDVNF